MWIKICCIQSLEEARWAGELGASAIGLVGRMPSGPGVIEDERIAEINRGCPNHLETFLLTSETAAADIIDHYQRAHTSAIQIVDHVDLSIYSALRMQLPGVKLIQAIHVSDFDDVFLAQQLESQVDGLLLDSGNPGGPTKTLGGTGRTHDWKISRKIVDSVSVPVYLAGGLHQENVRQAIDLVRPSGVDVCTGVRISGKLDLEKLEAFVKEVTSF